MDFVFATCKHSHHSCYGEAHEYNLLTYCLGSGYLLSDNGDVHLATSMLTSGPSVITLGVKSILLEPSRNTLTPWLLVYNCPDTYTLEYSVVSSITCISKFCDHVLHQRNLQAFEIVKSIMIL